MNLLDASGPPTREKRLKACNAFGGTACELVAGSKGGCLGNNNRSFSQSTGCQLMLSMAIAGTIPESVIVFHGPVGCGSCLLSMAGLSKTNQAARGNTGRIGQYWFSTNLGEIEVVSGGEARLEATLREVDRRVHPQVIFVANSCVPAVIGDDTDEVVQRVQADVKARILPLHCAGFKTKIVATAYDVVYHAILKYLLKEVDGQPKLTAEQAVQRQADKERGRRTVNLLNVASMSRGDEVELTRLIQAIGLEVNVLPCFAAPNRFAAAKDAALSVSICATHDDYFVEHLKELYGVPYVLNTIPIGITHTRRWLFEIADFFGLREKAEQVAAAEEAEVRSALLPFLPVLRGKCTFTSAGEIRAGAQAILLREDLGMEVLAVRAHHYDRYGDVLFQDLEENLPVNVGASQPFEQVNLLKRLKPDIYVGHLGGNVWTAKLGIPVLPIFGPNNNYMGYRGLHEVAARLYRVLRNPQYFTTLGRTTRLPYKQSWFESDPFSFIRDSNEQATVRRAVSGIPTKPDRTYGEGALSRTTV
ncbi:MAG TPA: nitrogenase component 1 [Polyangiaceae bacterium]|nr:nitrogenase component 1 [Polyangiaceae bacterium]